MAFPLEKLRSDTPGVKHVVHLNNAGAALMPVPVTEAIIDYLQRESQIGGYEAAAEQAVELSNAYLSIAKLIGGQPEDIAITDSATRAWLTAFHAIKFSPGDIILTTQSEYASNFISFLQLKKQVSVDIQIIRPNPSGEICLDDFAAKLTPRVKLVAISHVPTNGGLVQPAEAIGRLVADHPCWYLLDACQSVGQMPVDVQAIACDFLSVTGRKYLRGPRGTGFLYTSKRARELLTPPWLDLASAEWHQSDRFELASGAKRFELWERNIASVLGLKAAVDYYLALDSEICFTRIIRMAAQLRKMLTEVSGIVVTDLGSEPCGIVTFFNPSLPSEEVVRRLRAKGINTSVSVQSSTRLDMEARGLPDLVRASLHYYNTEDELAKFVRSLLEVTPTAAG